ncbi:unnamed protein product [Pedinophyceae sp. YPF-701]|nr:unnamed protein product [Pedinophyceae sp. YPF-701]
MSKSKAFDDLVGSSLDKLTLGQTGRGGKPMAAMTRAAGHRGSAPGLKEPGAGARNTGRESATGQSKLGGDPFGGLGDARAMGRTGARDATQAEARPRERNGSVSELKSQAHRNNKSTAFSAASSVGDGLHMEGGLASAPASPMPAVHLGGAATGRSENGKSRFHQSHDDDDIFGLGAAVGGPAQPHAGSNAANDDPFAGLSVPAAQQAPAQAPANDESWDDLFGKPAPAGQPAREPRPDARAGPTPPDTGSYSPAPGGREMPRSPSELSGRGMDPDVVPVEVGRGDPGRGPQARSGGDRPSSGRAARPGSSGAARRAPESSPQPQASSSSRGLMSNLASWGRKAAAEARAAYSVARERAQELTQEVKRRVEHKVEERNQRRARTQRVVMDVDPRLIAMAASLLDMGDADRAAALQAMPEGDAAVVQHIMDQIVVSGGQVPISAQDLDAHGGDGGDPRPPSYEQAVRDSHEQHRSRASHESRRDHHRPQHVRDSGPQQQPDGARPPAQHAPPHPRDQERSSAPSTPQRPSADHARQQQPQKPRPPGPAPTSAPADDLIGFSGPAAAPHKPKPAAPAQQPAAARPAGQAGMPSGLGELFGVSVPTSSVQVDDEEGPADPNEPEDRKRLRQERLAKKRAQMEAALREKQERDMREAVLQAEKHDRKEVHLQKVTAWSKKGKGNVRALLASLQDVVWEGANWKPLSITELVDDAKLKKGYQKALLIVHPDKVKMRGGNVDQIVLADMIFDVLKTAWGKHSAK